LTADILTLDDFRRDDAGSAKIPTSECERLVHIGAIAIRDIASPLPKDWGEFWKASDHWWPRQAIATGPTAESWRRALSSLQSKVSTFVT
jgi:hypothetical protein